MFHPCLFLEGLYSRLAVLAILAVRSQDMAVCRCSGTACFLRLVLLDSLFRMKC